MFCVCPTDLLSVNIHVVRAVFMVCFYLKSSGFGKLPLRRLSNWLLPFQVEDIIHPRFLAELLSPDAQLDLMALVEELEKEVLTAEQVKEGRREKRQSSSTETAGRRSRCRARKARE